MSKYDDNIMNCAKSVWEVMHYGAYNRGMSLIKEKKYGDGRVIINTVGAFIKGLSKEREWDLEEKDVDLVRRYLKATGNVVVLSKIEQYKYRIFVRETWNDSLVLKSDTKVGPSPEDKVSPHDAGEDRDPAPVDYKCGVCGSTWGSQNALNSHKQVHKDKTVKRGNTPLEDDGYILHEHQVSILVALKDAGGRIDHDGGRVSTILQQAIGLDGASVSSSSRSLHDRGYVRREIRGKRTYKIWLTKEGKEVVANLNHYRASKYVVTDFLSVKGAFTAPKTKLYEDLSEAIGDISPNRAANGVRKLAEEGMVEMLREAPNAYPHGVVWKGESRTEAVTEDSEQVMDLTEDESSDSTEAVSVEEVDMPQKAQWLSDEALLILLKERLAKPKVDVQLTEQLNEATMKIEMIETLIEEVNAGRSTPLKALGEIEEALSL